MRQLVTVEVFCGGDDGADLVPVSCKTDELRLMTDRQDLVLKCIEILCYFVLGAIRNFKLYIQ